LAARPFRWIPLRTRKRHKKLREGKLRGLTQLGD
jgi:hypothetical protein